MFKYDICVIGGCGRVGLPLSVAFADKGLKVVIYDLDKARMEEIRKGIMPFMEEGCAEKLKQVINKTLTISDDRNSITQSKFIITTIGTPVEAHLNPQYTAMMNFFNDLLPYLKEGQCIILRSTVYPGTAERINRLLKEKNTRVNLAFCPERIVEGKALQELANLPQIVSAFDGQGVQEVSDLFKKLTPDIIVMEPLEAELAKLFTNTWRYIQFSTANQFFMLANQYNLDFYKIYHGMTYKYSRTQGLPKAGFAAGPCLFKDTMQLAAFSNNSFFLGYCAMLVNEGLPNYIVQRLKEKTNLRQKTVGILGMAFKANSDDERDSLAFKLKAILQIEAKALYCTDPYIKRDYFISVEKLIDICDIIILAAPHDQYRNLNIKKDKVVVDIWNFFNKGGVI
ncbi:MAG: nucleotide sugar dehydrogenase [Dehalococcoidales bacterium]